METILVFTDGSVNVKTKVGYGAYLIVTDFEQPTETLQKLVTTERFENTSSTKLELQTLLLALKNIEPENSKIVVYTDSQNIIKLPARRHKLTQNDYKNGKNELLKNHQLYKDFFRLTEKLNIEFLKVKGHQQAHKKDKTDKIFTIVDRASRKALRDAGGI